MKGSGFEVRNVLQARTDREWPFLDPAVAKANINHRARALCVLDWCRGLLVLSTHVLKLSSFWEVGRIESPCLVKPGMVT